MVFAVVAMAASAQKGRPIILEADTLTDAETKYIVTPQFTGDDVLSVQVLFTQLTGTAGGTATFEGSVDGVSYVPITDAVGVLKGYPNDTLTITDGAVTTWVLEKNNFYKYRVKLEGTGTQSTKVETAYIRK